MVVDGVAAMVRFCEAGAVPPSWNAKAKDAGANVNTGGAAEATVNVTGMVNDVLDAVELITTLPVNVPGARPVGSAVTVTVEPETVAVNQGTLLVAVIGTAVPVPDWVTVKVWVRGKAAVAGYA